MTLDHSLAAAWEAMRSQQSHHVAVVDGERVVAVLDDRTVAAEWPSGGPDVPHRRRVGDVVTPGVVCVLLDSSVADIAATMVETDADAVPVVEPDGRLLGLVTSSDVVAGIVRT